MTNLIGIYDHSTGENIVREMTDDEQIARNEQIAIWAAEKEKAQLEAEQARQTKISAYEKLGLTEAEIEALLPTSKPASIISAE